MARMAILLLGILAALLVGAGGDAPSPAAPATAAWPAGTLVVNTGSNRLTAIDVATGERTSLRIGSVASCGAQMFVTGGHVVFAGIRRGRTIVFAAPVTLDRRPTRLGVAHAYVPSAVPGRVWLAGTDCDLSRMHGVREVTVGGESTAESDRVIPTTWLEAAAPGGLVVMRDRELAVWDPQTGALEPLDLAAVAATHGSLLAGCADGCHGLVVHDTATGRRVQPRGRELDLGAVFSPDGSQLAAPSRDGRRWRVALLDTATGDTTLVPGLRSRDHPVLSWSPSSGWLFIHTGPRRIAAYRPGLPRPVGLPFRLPRNTLSYVAG